MERLKECAASRYCRVRTAVKTTALVLAGSIIAMYLYLHQGGI